MLPRYRPLIVALILLFIGFGPPQADAQAQGAVSGRVTEAESGAPLPGANVVVEDARLGVSTDRNGRFELRNVPEGSQTLIVSFIGFENAEVTVDVQAGTTVEQNVELASKLLQSGEVIVTGLREGQVRAMNQKKQALQVMDVLSADAIGKLPDQNVAEAVQRLPGVSIRTDRGEGRFVRIRGTSSELNNVTLNGGTLASTASSRATALDLVPANMISGVEVVKAVTPDMEANAVGGTLNINTLTAFDRADTFASGTVSGLVQPEVVEFGKREPRYRANATAGTQFGADNQFGIVASVSASRRDFTVSTLDPDTWVLNEETGFLFPNELESQAEENERERYGANLNLDYQPSAQTQLYVRSLFTRRIENEINTESELTFEGDLVNQTERTGQFTRGSVELDLAPSEQTDDLYSFSLGGEQQIGAVALSVDGTYTRGDSEFGGPDLTFETPGGGDGDPRASASYNTKPYFFEITPDNPAFVADPANYALRTVQLESRDIIEDTYVASTDIRWNTELGSAEGYVKVGGKIQARDKTVDESEINYDPTDQAPSLAEFAISPLDVFQPNGIFYVSGDVQAGAEYVRNNFDDESQFVFLADDTAEDEAEGDSDNEETIYAGYGMASFDIGRLNILGGVRIEHTAAEVTRFQLVDDGDFSEDDLTRETETNGYTNVLPSLHLRFAATPDLILRASWSNTIGRPDYDLLASFEEVETEGTTQINISRGNPDLEPFTATSFDLAAEYYLARGGLFSVGGFYKRINNPIYEDEQLLQDFTFEGVTYDEAEIEQTVNADAGTLLGLEATVDVLFTFLPQPLDGFGLASNVAFIESEVEVPGREGELPFFGQSDLVLNVAPYFQKWGFQARMAWSYQSAALTQLESSPSTDRYDDKRSTVDASLSYDVNRTLTEALGSVDVKLFGEVQNITNEPETRYQGNPSQYDRHLVYGRTFTLGVTTSF